MIYPVYSIVELAFYKKSTFQYLYTKPDYVFILKHGNGPPILSLSATNTTGTSCEIAQWCIYDEKNVYGNSGKEKHSYDECFYNEKILSLCVLVLGLFVERDEELIMVGKGFSNNILKQKGIFDTYRELNLKQLDYLIDIACKTVSSKYRVLSYCEAGIDIIQDIQKNTAGLHFKQYRYPERTTTRL